jgi:prepilin-type N-terminal cleavage/methylation domain-containing protein
MRSRAGFTMVEVLIATTITAVIVAAILSVIGPAQAIVRAQGEAADLHQRLRAAADGLAGDLRAAAGVRPYRVGAVRDDGVAGVYYRPDTIAVLGDETRTYYVKADTFELMQYDGGVSDLPMVEHVVGLGFEYFGADGTGRGLARIDPGRLVDGPWTEDASHRRVDADVQRIRDVRVFIRLESTAPSLRRLVPDAEITFDVALRNREQVD